MVFYKPTLSFKIASSKQYSRNEENVQWIRNEYIAKTPAHQPTDKEDKDKVLIMSQSLEGKNTSSNINSNPIPRSTCVSPPKANQPQIINSSKFNNTLKLKSKPKSKYKLPPINNKPRAIALNNYIETCPDFNPFDTNLIMIKGELFLSLIFRFHTSLTIGYHILSH